jgi:hypothetical protein
MSIGSPSLFSGGLDHCDLSHSFFLVVLTTIIGSTFLFAQQLSVTRLDDTKISPSQIDTKITRLRDAARVTGVGVAVWNVNLANHCKGSECLPDLGVDELTGAGLRSSPLTETGTRKMRKQFRSKLNGDVSRDNGTASFTLPFDTREVWGWAKVPVKVTINGYTWRSTVGNRGGIQYLVVNAAARRHAGVKAGDTVTIALEPDTEQRDIEIPIQLRRALGVKLTEKLNRLSFSHKKEFVVWYSGAKKEETRTRRIEKMKAMLSTGKAIS